MPRTSTSRNGCPFVKLLTRVREWAPFGLGFEGTNHRAGSKIDIAALPRPAIALEYAGTEKRYGKCCQAGSFERYQIWILWRFDFDRVQWTELARAASTDSSWADVLKPAAAFQLRGGRPEEPAPVNAIAARIVAALDRELADIAPAYRAAVLSAVEPQIAGRIAAYLGE